MENICIFPKVDRGWQNYFDYSQVPRMTQESIRRFWAKSECFFKFINEDIKSYV